MFGIVLFLLNVILTSAGVGIFLRMEILARIDLIIGEEREKNNMKNPQMSSLHPRSR